MKKIALVLSLILLTGCASELEDLGFSSPDGEAVATVRTRKPKRKRGKNNSASMTESNVNDRYEYDDFYETYTETEDFPEFTTEKTTEFLGYCSIEPNGDPERFYRGEAVNEELYNGVVNSLKDFTMVSYYNDLDIDIADVGDVVDKIEITHPEFFWISTYNMNWLDNRSSVTIKSFGDYTTEQLKTMFFELEAAADNLIRQIPQGDDYSKALFVHDYLVNTTKYDIENVNNGRGLYHTAYGCLVNGKAVCSGYSAAFQYIMNRLGIECGICTGNTYSGRHAWNYVNLDGQYYWIDVTWDDPISGTGDEDYETLNHNYCFIDDSRLYKTRNADQDGQFVPVCQTLDNNYYVRLGTYVYQYDPSVIGNIFDRYRGTGEVEIMFSDEAVYKEAITELMDNGGIWDYINDDNISYSIDDSICTLRVTFE